MQRVRFIKSPRPSDPEPLQALWIGLEATVVATPEEPLPETLLWVDYEEIINEIDKRGHTAYTDFFRRLRASPGGSAAPGFCVFSETCKIIV